MPASTPTAVPGAPPAASTLGPILGENLPVKNRQRLLADICPPLAAKLGVSTISLAAYVANTLNPAAANMAQMNLAHERLLFDALSDARRDSDNIGLVLNTLGGAGDFPTRVLRFVREDLRAASFYVIVPQFAKSAGTLLSLSADGVITGPSTQFGPIDPQLPRVTNHGQSWVSARAVKESYEKLVSSQLAKLPPAAQVGVAQTIDWLLLQQALDSIQYTKDYVARVKAERHKGLKDTDVVRELIETPLSHGSDVSPSKLASYGVPVIQLPLNDPLGNRIDEYLSRCLKGLLMEMAPAPAASLVLFESPRTSFAISAVLQTPGK